MVDCTRNGHDFKTVPLKGFFKGKLYAHCNKCGKSKNGGRPFNPGEDVMCGCHHALYSHTKMQQNSNWKGCALCNCKCFREVV